MRRLYVSLATAAAILFAAPAFALTATQVVEKEVVVKNDDGTETVTRKSAELVVPGERIVYTLNFLNDHAESASDLVLTMPIPAAVNFIEGSADNAAAIVTYSADGGQTFASRETVVVLAENGKAVPAKAGEITHVRWLVAGPVAPGDTGQLAFKGILK